MFLLILLLLVKFTAIAQQPIIQSVSSGNYAVSLESYHNTIESETNFSYTVTINLPDGPNINTVHSNIITAWVDYPEDANFVNISHYPTFGGPPGGYTPVDLIPAPANSHTAGIRITLPSPNTNVAMQASFTVTVRVPAARACNGKMYNATASLTFPTAADPMTITTAPEPIQLLVTNHWIVKKYAINTFRIGNSTVPGACNDATADNPITYQVIAYLQHPTNVGAQDLTITSMTDIPSIGGCTFSNIGNLVNMAGLASFVGTTGVFNVPANTLHLIAANAVNNSYHQFTLQMQHNAPSNTCIDNFIDLRANDFCGNDVPVPAIHAFTETRSAAPGGGLRVVKTAWQQGNYRGCNGGYFIRVTNTNPAGGANIVGYDLFDFAPDCLDNGTGPFANGSWINAAGTTRAPVNQTFGYTACIGGCFTPVVGPIPHTFQLHSNNTLLPGQFEITFVPFTIGNNCQGCFPNFIYNVINPPVPLTAAAAASSANVCLLEDEQIPCIRKSVVCNSLNHQYHLGESVRFKISIQNFGSVPLTNYTLTDDLAALGLTYVPGSVRYYVARSRVAENSIPNGCMGLNPSYINHVSTLNPDIHEWSATSPAPYNQPPLLTPGGILSFNLSTFYIDCPPFEGNVVNGCEGAAGQNLPAFFIEFSATVGLSAGVGEIRNWATLTGGNPVHTVSGNAVFSITDDLNLTLSKEVSTNGGSTWSTGGITATPGQTIQYRLRVNNIGLGLQQPFLLDYLPLNNNQGQQNDRYLIVNHTPPDRGSTCNVFYRSVVPSPGSTLGYSERFDPTDPQPEEFDASNVNADILGVTGVVGSYPPNFNWPTLPNTPTKNVKIEYPSLGHGSVLTYRFNAQIDPSALVGQTACNTFAVRGRKKSIVDYQEVPNGVLQLPAESPKVCIGITDRVCCVPTSFKVPETVCRNVDVQFCVTDDCTCLPVDLQNIYTWDFHDNTQTQQNKCVTHTFTHGGNYDITVSWTNCQTGETITQTFHVTVQDDCSECKINPQVDIPTVSGPTVHLDASSSFSNQPVLLYLWNFGDGTTGSGPIVDHTYQQPGSYDIHLTIYTLDPNNPKEVCGCSKEIWVHVDVEQGSGGKPMTAKVGAITVSKGKQETGISMTATPNPFNSSLTVTFKGAGKATQTKGNLSLIDTNGKTIMTQKITNLTIPVRLDTKSYSSGSYLLTMQGADGTLQTTQLVKIN